MRRFSWLSEAVLNHKKIILSVFLVLTLVSGFLSSGVIVNYRLMDYLPEDSPSTVSLQVMNNAFDSPPPNLRVLVRDVSVTEALSWKARLAQTGGVQEISWLDDAADIHTPLEAMEPKIRDAWYRDGNALFSILVDNDDVETAVTQIRELVGERGAMSGDAVNISSAQETTGSEVTKIMLFLIPLILVILLLTTSSWFEPVLFLVSVGAAIVLNVGTNIFFDDISFITMATSSVLQLAVSMDYSIFLLHRFSEYRAEGLPVREAMSLAMTKSFPTILASGLTTIIGFVALLFMRFQLGQDMGLVLAKGIVFSLLSSLLLLPVLTVFTYKLIDRTHHRSFLPSFRGFGKAVTKLFIPVVAAVALLIVPAYLSQQHNTFLYGSSAMSSDENSQSGRDEAEIDGLFGKANQMVLLVPSENPVREKELIGRLYELPEVSSAVSYAVTVGNAVPREYVPEDMLLQLVSDGYSRIVLTVRTSQESPEAFAVVERIRDTAGELYGGNYYFTGGSVNVYDMKETVVADNQIVTIAGIIGIGLVILLVFRSLSLPLILLLCIETSIWINLAIPYFLDGQMAYIGFMIISSVQLGATVDYAILFAGRYLENRTALGKKEAAVKTVADTTASILTSAGILTTAGVVLSIISTNRVIGDFGDLIGRGAALSAAMVLLFLPAMLVLLDGILPKTTMGLHFLKSGKERSQ